MLSRRGAQCAPGQRKIIRFVGEHSDSLRAACGLSLIHILVADPGVIDPEAFLHEVLGERYPNPFLQDSPQRTATDTSRKIAPQMCIRDRCSAEHSRR